MNKKGYINTLELNKYIKDGYFTVEKHPDSDLYIYGYATGPFSSTNLRWNNTTRQMRGLVLNGEGKVMARSFQKFFTFKKYLSSQTVQLSDGQIARLPNLPHKVYEKLDGSLGLLYWIGDVPYIASQRSFTSLKAKKATEILHAKYKSVFGKLKKDRTYVFEVIYPESKVLIDYGDKEELILLGIINNETGKEYPLENIGFPIAKDWTKELSSISTLDEYQLLNLENKEGLVIVYENGFRVKIKFNWYKEAHLLINKIILYENHIDAIEIKLKALLNFPVNVPDTKTIWKRFEEGESISKIQNDFPYRYQFVGIEKWLEEEYHKFSQSKGKGNVLPKSNIKFDIKKLLFKPSSENIMWNRWKKLENKYD